MSDRRGFSIVELMVSLVIFAIGVLAGLTLIGAGHRYQGQARLETDMTVLAESKIEELRAVAGTDLPDTVALVPGGDLDSDVPGYYDAASLDDWAFRRRWRVEIGPTGTREVVVHVEPLVPPAAGEAELSTTVLHE